MGSELVRWNPSAGMGSVLLLSFPSLFSDMTVFLSGPSCRAIRPHRYQHSHSRAIEGPASDLGCRLREDH